MSEEILKVLEKLKDKSNYQRDCNDESYFIELFANEIYILCKFMEDLQQKVEQLEKEIDRLNNIINELENTIANFIKNHTESYIDWKYDREIYLAESNVLQKLFDNYLDKLKELKENNNGK